MEEAAAQFASLPRNNPQKPRRVRCLNPFRWLEVNEGGDVTPCCGSWFKGNLGSLKNQTLEEIWNGERYRAARAAMFDGGDWEQFCNAQTCPQIYNDTWVNVDFISPQSPDIVPITDEMLDEVRNGHTAMRGGPVQIGLSCDPRCNLRCIMCSAPAVKDRSGALIKRALDGVRQFLPSVRRIKLLGDGEVFVVPEARDFLFQFDSKKYPHVEFLIHTNGLLLNEAMWAKIAHIKIDWLVVSIDAATKETYEKIRIGGDWDALLRNLDFMAQKYSEGYIRSFHLSMTVMKTNHREMGAFAEMGRRLRATSTYFFPIIGDYGGEQIFDNRDIPALRRVAEQLRLPIMGEAGIDINALERWRNWQPTFSDYMRCFRNLFKRRRT